MPDPRPHAGMFRPGSNICLYPDCGRTKSEHQQDQRRGVVPSRLYRPRPASDPEPVKRPEPEIPTVSRFSDNYATCPHCHWTNGGHQNPIPFSAAYVPVICVNCCGKFYVR